MVHYDLEYPKQPYSTVKRYDSRATYALKTIHHLISTSPILSISFNTPDTPFPTILPMIGALGSYTRPSASLSDPQDLYLHGYVSSRIINLSRASTSSSAPDTPPGLPICISATHLDGLVLSLTPNSHSYNYRSATLFGHAVLVSDPEEKLYAMRLITDGVLPGRWDNTRTPPNAGEMASTSVLRVKLVAGSAKVRAGGPNDDKGDMNDEEVRERVWTGVVPVSRKLGEPVGSGYNRVAEVPGYIREFVEEANEEGEREAVEAAGRTAAPKKVFGEEE
ncbi:hypothetical protein GE09DRAFT_743086 [Coniochaeta sp. 2T2.1]|nr:hypothetical protein GE09DRAFT_743086 [Coniochaeta sp. 2T2.1]